VRALLLLALLQAATFQLPGTPQTADPQKPPEYTAAIKGRVLGSDSRALARAQLRLVALEPPGPLLFAVTDDAGEYEFQHVRSGTYSLSANRAGYIGLEYGQQRPLERGLPIFVGLGASLEKIDFALPRASVVTGRIEDENGDPLEGVRVVVQQIRFVGGRRRLVAAAPGGPGPVSRTTNDIGRYRFFALQPGQYILTASVGQVYPGLGASAWPGYATTYFPGTPNPSQARFITIDLGQEVTADFAMARTETASIFGTATNSDGVGITGGISMRPTDRSGSVSADSVGARIWPDGRFQFPNVAPGEYVIQVYRGKSQPAKEGEFAAAIVTVNGKDVKDLEIQTSEGLDVGGHVSFNGAAARPRPGQVAISTAPIDMDTTPPPGGLANADVQDDWTFYLSGLRGRRRFSVREPSGWALEAIRLDGIDVTDTPIDFDHDDLSKDLEIALTDQVAGVIASVVDTRGAAVTDCTVVLFSTDAERWYPRSRYFKQAGLGRLGAFSLSPVPPGEYYIAAIDARPGVDATEWQDPVALEALARSARKISLTAGQQISVSLKLQTR
jgi:hypothetical protein